MKLKVVILCVNFLTVLQLTSIDLHAQELKKKTLFGSYSHSDGLPGKLIKESDGRELHISPMVLSRETLHLKRFGRFKLEQFHREMENMPAFKGTWKIENDTVVLKYRKGSAEYIEKFTFRKPVYLENVGTGNSYQKID